MKFDFSLLYYVVGLIFGFIFCFVGFASASPFNLTLQQQQTLCSNLTLSFTQCYELWDSINNPKVINNTVYINVTQNVTEDVLSGSLEEIKEMQELGFVPLYDEGKFAGYREKPVLLPVSNPSESSSVYTEEQLQEEILKAKQNFEQSQTTKEKGTSFPWYVWVGSVLLLVFGFMYYLKNQDKFKTMFTKDDFSTPTYEYSSLHTSESASVPVQDKKEDTINDTVPPSQNKWQTYG